MGICGLCQNEADLRVSHYIPASVYRLLRAAEAEAKTDLVVVTPRASYRSSTHIATHLLCPDCEDRLSKRGERIVIAECLRSSNTFLLRDNLRRLTPALSKRESHWFADHNLSSIDAEAYRFFAASMFWRSSAGRWKGGEAHEWRGQLGEKYQEAFRKYLLDEAPFPQDALLCVYVANQADPMPYASVVGTRNRGGFHAHQFFIPGLQFLLLIGGRMDPSITKVFRHLGSTLAFILKDLGDLPSHRDLVRLVQGSPARGKLIELESRDEHA